jgi:tuberculosinol/isotuberculosinol synthase
MKRETFQNLPLEEVRQLVRGKGVGPCVFPINGTRRWFALEHGLEAEDDAVTSYLEISGQRHIELYKLFFDHGIDTLVTPIFGPDLLQRGDEYRALLRRGLTWFATDQRFLAFYADYDVRVRVYGDAERHLRNSPYAEALDAYADLEARTASHQRRRLFFGVCAHDAAESVAEIGIRFHQERGRPPSKREIVEAYYGEYLKPVDIFIGFDRLAAYDMPLIATGSEDLYFTVSPSPYLDGQTLRAILYDHLYARQVNDDVYHGLSEDDWETMEAFYSSNRHSVLGLGKRTRNGRIWYPLPQVKLPASTASPRQG